ncbi:hypothetical protein J4Q44_G00224530 [Coregonus suidteri]|uniref:Uncharacterized protein n=1 Tax=Coregonus suidteri TaxID=861788 RepID=A0AAN8LC87_9TELE
MVTLEERTRAELLCTEAQAAPWCDTSLSGGLQHILDKKQKHSSTANHAGSAQAERTFRQIRRTASTLPTTGLLPNRYRALITYPNQEDSRISLLSIHRMTRKCTAAPGR